MEKKIAHSLVSYYKTDILPERNCLVEDIETYLSSVSSKVVDIECQYQIQGLSTSIKLIIEQEKQEGFDYNYFKIENFHYDETLQTEVGEGACYYFIATYLPVSQNTMQFVLLMDTVNTCGAVSTSKGNPRNFTAKTAITREHEDRFVKPAVWRPATDRVLRRRFDYKNEGVAPEKVKTKDENIYTNFYDKKNWYLIYRAKGEGATAEQPITIDLCNDEAIKIQSASSTSSRVYSRTDFEQGYYYYFCWQDNKSGAFDVVDTTNGVSMTRTFNWTNSDNAPNKMLALYNDGTDLLWSIVDSASGNYEQYATTVEGQGGATRYIKVRTPAKSYSHSAGRTTSPETSSYSPTESNNISGPFFKSSQITFRNGLFFRKTSTNVLNLLGYYVSKTINNLITIDVGQQDITIRSISQVDITDTKIISIIAYPYCPIAYYYDDINRVFEFGDDWTYFDGLIRYNKTGIPELEGKQLNLDLSDVTLYTLPSTPTSSDTPNIELESKLYNSENRTEKIGYDSFTKQIELEKFHPNSMFWNNQQVLPIYFKPTSSLNSKMLWKIGYDFVGSYDYDDDFGEYLMATRNNNVTTLNSEYLNYMKNGYNYDMKSNALAEKRATISAALSTAGSLIQGAGAIAGLGRTSALSANAKEVIRDTIESANRGIRFASMRLERGGNGVNPETERAMIERANKRISGLQEVQSNSVGSNISSISRVQATANIANAATNIFQAWQNVSNLKEDNERAMKQKLTELQAQSVSVSGTDDFDLLKYYSDNKLHHIVYEPRTAMKEALAKAFSDTGYVQSKQAVPSVDSRYWFNFIQCSPRYDKNCSDANYIKQDVLDDLSTKYEVGVTVLHNRNGQWNFNKDKENYERWILEGVN